MSSSPPGRGPDRFREEFAREIGLSQAQQVQVDTLMARQMRALDEIRRRTDPEMRAVIEDTRRAIENVLTPEQKKRLEVFRQRFERPGPGRGPRPPGEPPSGGGPGGRPPEGWGHPPP